MAPSSSRAFIRLAGLSGAAALALAAYGSHGLRDRSDVSAQRKLAFDTANRLHLIHSAVLLAGGQFKYPALTGGLLVLGQVIFCGTCYYYGITGEESVRKYTPMGGVTLIVAWLSMVL